MELKLDSFSDNILENNGEVSAENFSDRDVIYTLRTACQSQGRLVLLADQKANALIGVMTLIFTILLTKSDYLITLGGCFSVAIVGFMLIELSAVLMALLVILPQTIKRAKVPSLDQVSNPLFFGFFSQFEEGEFCDFMSNRLVNDRAARELLITDLYQVGVVLQRKYHRLRLAYLLSSAGIVLLFCLVVAFLFTH